MPLLSENTYTIAQWFEVWGSTFLRVVLVVVDLFALPLPFYLTSLLTHANTLSDLRDSHNILSDKIIGPIA